MELGPPRRQCGDPGAQGGIGRIGRPRDRHQHRRAVRIPGRVPGRIPGRIPGRVASRVPGRVASRVPGPIAGQRRERQRQGAAVVAAAEGGEDAPHRPAVGPRIRRGGAGAERRPQHRVARSEQGFGRRRIGEPGQVVGAPLGGAGIDQQGRVEGPGRRGVELLQPAQPGALQGELIVGVDAVIVHHQMPGAGAGSARQHPGGIGGAVAARRDRGPGGEEPAVPGFGERLGRAEDMAGLAARGEQPRQLAAAHQMAEADPGPGIAAHHDRRGGHAGDAPVFRTPGLARAFPGDVETGSPSGNDKTKA